MWFYFSLACAVLTAANASLYKLALKKNDQYVSAWLSFVLSTVIFLIFLFSSHPAIPDKGFWVIMAVLLPLEAVAFLIYLKALKISAISLVYPFMGLTPLFSIATSYIFLKERLVPSGIVGIGCIVAGAYLIEAHAIKRGALEPIRRIFKERGVLLIILASFIYSINVTLGKKAMLYVGPIVFPSIHFPLFFALLTPIMLYRLKKRRSVININFKDVILYSFVSISFVLMAIFHFKAISLTKVSYMVSIKRMSLLFAVLSGAIFFKEEHIKYRVLGALIMVLGAVVIAVSQR